MERSFGQSFATVRVRTGRPLPPGLAAVTDEEQIHLPPQASPLDRAVLGHELAHVVQRRLYRLKGRTPGDFEGEAQAAGLAAAHGLPASVTQGAAPGPLAMTEEQKAKLKAIRADMKNHRSLNRIEAEALGRRITDLQQGLVDLTVADGNARAELGGHGSTLAAHLSSLSTRPPSATAVPQRTTPVLPPSTSLPLRRSPPPAVASTSSVPRPPQTLFKTEVHEPRSQTITGGPKAWNQKYDWDSKFALKADTAKREVTAKIRLYSTASAKTRSNWSEDIENKWSNRFNLQVGGDDPWKSGLYRIHVRPKWVSDPRRAHYTITPSSQVGSAITGRTQGLGGTENLTTWGAVDRVDVPHEVGHILGNKDEYHTVDLREWTAPGEAARKGVDLEQGSIMNDPKNNPLARHYELIRLKAADLLGVHERHVGVEEAESLLDAPHFLVPSRLPSSSAVPSAQLPSQEAVSSRLKALRSVPTTSVPSPEPPELVQQDFRSVLRRTSPPSTTTTTTTTTPARRPLPQPPTTTTTTTTHSPLGKSPTSKLIRKAQPLTTTTTTTTTPGRRPLPVPPTQRPTTTPRPEPPREKPSSSAQVSPEPEKEAPEASLDERRIAILGQRHQALVEHLRPHREHEVAAPFIEKLTALRDRIRTLRPSAEHHDEMYAIHAEQGVLEKELLGVYPKPSDAT